MCVTQCLERKIKKAVNKILVTMQTETNNEQKITDMKNVTFFGQTKYKKTTNKIYKNTENI